MEIIKTNVEIPQNNYTLENKEKVDNLVQECLNDLADNNSVNIFFLYREIPYDVAYSATLAFKEKGYYTYQTIAPNGKVTSFKISKRKLNISNNTYNF